MISVLAISFLVAAAIAWGAWEIWRRRLDCWLTSYALQVGRRRSPRRGEPVHVLLCIADHFEPRNGNVSEAQGHARVEQWATEYPAKFGEFRDSDGRPP